MSCCGRHPSALHRRLAHAPRGTLHARRNTHFRYVGPSHVTVIGPATGRRYHFSGPGATVHADPRDAPAIAAVPHLITVDIP